MRNRYLLVSLFLFLVIFTGGVLAYFTPTALTVLTVSSQSYLGNKGFSCFNATDDNQIYCMLVYQSNTYVYIRRLNSTNLSTITSCSVYGTNYIHAVAMLNTTHGYAIGYSPASIGSFTMIGGVCSFSPLKPIGTRDPFSIDLDRPLELIYIGNDGEVYDYDMDFNFNSGTGDVTMLSLADGTSEEIYVPSVLGDIRTFFGGNSSFSNIVVEIEDFEYNERWYILEEVDGSDWLYGVEKYDSIHIGIAKYNMTHIFSQYEEGYESNETEDLGIFNYDFSDIPSGMGGMVGLDEETSNLLFSLVASLVVAVVIILKLKSKDSNTFLLTFLVTFVICWAVGLVPNYLMFLIGFVGAVLFVNKIRS